jgi:hypothetical protein
VRRLSVLAEALSVVGGDEDERGRAFGGGQEAAQLAVDEATSPS